MTELHAAIHQPNFMPWLGYFHKMSLVDIFVLFDDVQVPTGKSFASRVLIKTHAGELWLSVPTLDRSDRNDFNSISILASNWQAKNLKTIRLAYQKAPHFKTYFESFEHALRQPPTTLFDLNYGLLLFLKSALEIKTSLVRSSQLGIAPEITGAQKILATLQAVKATTYVSGKGSGSTRYINEQDFNEKNIRLTWQEFTAEPYPQLHGSFIPNLSALDYLFNCGPLNLR
jgi:WbqC-like protein family